MGLFNERELKFIEENAHWVESAIESPNGWRLLYSNAARAHFNVDFIYRLAMALVHLSENHHFEIEKRFILPSVTGGNLRLHFKSDVSHFPIFYMSDRLDAYNYREERRVLEKVIDELTKTLGNYYLIQEFVIGAEVIDVR